METLWACPCWVSLSIQVGNFGFSPLPVKCGDCRTLLGPWVNVGLRRKTFYPISSFPRLQPAHECCFPAEMGQATSSFSFPYSPSKGAEHVPPPLALAQALAVGQSTAHHPTRALAPSWRLGFLRFLRLCLCQGL